MIRGRLEDAIAVVRFTGGIKPKTSGIRVATERTEKLLGRLVQAEGLEAITACIRSFLHKDGHNCCISFAGRCLGQDILESPRGIGTDLSTVEDTTDKTTATIEIRPCTATLRGSTEHGEEFNEFVLADGPLGILTRIQVVGEFHRYCCACGTTRPDTRHRVGEVIDSWRE